MTILVTGATGTVGRQVVRQLLLAGVLVRAMTRNPATANLPDGVEVVQGDLALPETLSAALEGVDHVFHFPVPGALVDLAKQQGVKRIVTLTSYGIDDKSEGADVETNYANELAVERAVEASGLEWTYVRPGEFMANALDWAKSVRTENVVRTPFPDIRGIPIHEADIAAVAVKALLEDGHHGAIYRLTGPEVTTPAERVRIISAAISREIRLEHLTPAQARIYWRESGWVEEMIDWMLGGLDGDELIVYDYPAPAILPTVEQVTGRPARTFAQWALDHADDFR